MNTEQIVAAFTELLGNPTRLPDNENRLQWEWSRADKWIVVAACHDENGYALFVTWSPQLQIGYDARVAGYIAESIEDFAQLLLRGIKLRRNIPVVPISVALECAKKVML